MKNGRFLLAAMVLFGLLFAARSGVSAAPVAQSNVSALELNQTVYLPLVTKPIPIKNGDFEAGRDGSWTEDSWWDFQLIYNAAGLPIDVYPHGGSWAAWLGGEDHEIAKLSQTISLSGVRYLHFWYWIASEDSCNKDYARVFINGTLLLTQTLCLQNDTNGWVPATLDLNSYAGGTVLLEFEVTTDQALNSNYFLDDVSLTSSQTLAEPYVPIYEKVDAAVRKADIP